MSSIFQKNAIIAGYINSHCLVCEHSFETLEDTMAHITSDEHTNSLRSHPHLEKYGNNCIRKVKSGYFCECCSQLIPTAPKVNLHISEKQHYHNKGTTLLRRSGRLLTAFNDTIIHDNAWHTFSDDTCGLCNQEFDDEKEHKNERAHLLKLIQNKVEFGDNNNLYRKVDKNDFQCLTCNNILPLNTLEDHFNSDDHNQTYVQCQTDKIKFDEQNVTIIEKFEEEKKEFLRQAITKNDSTAEKEIYEKNTRSSQSNTERNNNGLEKLETKSNSPPIAKDMKSQNKKDDKIKETKAPVKSTGTVPKDTKQTEKITNEEKKLEPNIPKDEISIYASTHNLTYSPGNNSAFCKTCTKKFPSSLRNMKEHVTGRDHINKTAKAAQVPVAKKKAKLEKKRMENFVTHVSTFNNTVDNDTIINETYCVPEKSCHLFTKAGSRYRCQICEVYLNDEDDMEEHCSTAKHEKGFRECNIILNLGSEFVREVRPEVYHCGYCNLVISGWSDMDAHLKNSADHKNNSASCERRLQIHLPAVRAAKADQKAREAFFAMFVNHMRIN